MAKLPSKEERKRRVARGVSANPGAFKGTRSEAKAMSNLRKRGLESTSAKSRPGESAPHLRFKRK